MLSITWTDATPVRGIGESSRFSRGWRRALDRDPKNLKVVGVKTVPADHLRWNLTQVAQDVAEGARIVCTYRGKPRFALVSVADLERLEKLDRAKKPAKPKR